MYGKLRIHLNAHAIELLQEMIGTLGGAAMSSSLNKLKALIRHDAMEDQRLAEGARAERKRIETARLQAAKEALGRDAG